MSTIDIHLFYRFAVALGIGFLIGLEREHKRREHTDLFAGVRTFSLIALVGCTAAMISDQVRAPWPLTAAIFVLGGLLISAYVTRSDPQDYGLTTETAAILTFLIGALCYWDYLAPAAALGVVAVALLSLKLQLHRLVERITYDDIYATLKFAVISLIILPILPDVSLGPPPLDVLNLHNIWLMVVLICGISFLGYVLMKVVDPRRGIGLTGFLGGLVSSTAVTLTFSQRSREQAALAMPFAVAILIAWSVMFGRVVVEVLAVNRALLRELWLPLAGAAAVALVYIALLLQSQKKIERAEITLDNPFELTPAIKFGALYALILLIARTAELYFGSAGIYASSLIAGVADVDAITLTLARLSGPTGTLDMETAGQAIILATMSNTLVKAGIVFFTGAVALRRILLIPVPLMVITAVGLAWLF